MSLDKLCLLASWTIFVWVSSGIAYSYFQKDSQTLTVELNDWRCTAVNTQHPADQEDTCVELRRGK